MKTLQILSKILTKTNVKVLLWTLFGGVVVYLLIWVTTPEPKSQPDFAKQIDSLNAIAKKLIEKQKYYDSLKSIDEKKILEVENKIKNIKEKTTIVKEYYYEKNKVIGNYDIRQLDSFFSSRYGH